MPTEYEREASPDREVELLGAELLAGVPLTASERDQAVAIIRADVEARRRIPLAPVDAPWAAWDRGVASMAERDAALERLLSTEAQRAAFGRNATKQREVLRELRRQAERHAAGGSLGG